MNALYRSLNISKQAVHQQLVRMEKHKEEELQLLKLIYDIRDDHPTMGIRDMYFMLQPQHMGRDRFEEFCRMSAVKSQKPSNYRRTTNSTGVVRFDNLIQNIEFNRTDQVWQSDITYYEIKHKFYYLTFILDSFSRRIIGHQASERLSTEYTTLPALKMAIKTRKGKNLKGLIFHSDGGGQYYDKEFLCLTKKANIRNSMCEYAWENGKAERINGVIKNNYLKHRSINNMNELRVELDRAVLLYNSFKPHKMLKRMTPITFEKEYLYLHEQTKPRMTESFEANTGLQGHRAPTIQSKQSLQTPDVFSANP